MAALMMSVLTLVSCMNEDPIETSPECAIVSFSVGSISSSVITKKYDSSGNATDTVVRKTLTGSDIHFNINQVEGHIYTVDSLPNWVNLTRVVPSFTCYGNVYRKVEGNDSLYYNITSGSDSIDFSKPVELMCIATDGHSYKTYTVDIYKHVANTDTLEWKATTSDLAIAGESKLFYTASKVFAFAQNEDGESVVTIANSNDATTWSTPMVIPVASESIVLFKDAFYGQGTDGYLYRSTPEQLAATWTKASDQQVERLVAADAYFLYAYDGLAIIGTADLNTWAEQGSTDLDMLPETSVNVQAYTSNTNSAMQQVVLTGISSHNSEHAVVWYKTTTQEVNTNQPWAYIQVTPDNPFGLPRLHHLSVTRYNKALYAIGAENGAYKYLYRSDDNGIAWHPQTEKYPMPADLDADKGAASIVAVDKQLWIIQENGTIWQGSIQ